MVERLVQGEVFGGDRTGVENMVSARYGCFFFSSFFLGELVIEVADGLVGR